MHGAPGRTGWQAEKNSSIPRCKTRRAPQTCQREAGPQLGSRRIRHRRNHVHTAKCHHLQWAQGGERLLLDRGGDASAAGQNGWTPLHLSHLPLATTEPRQTASRCSGSGTGSGSNNSCGHAFGSAISRRCGRRPWEWSYLIRGSLLLEGPGVPGNLTSGRHQQTGGSHCSPPDRRSPGAVKGLA